MVFLPIVTRELRVAARRSKTYYARMTVAGIWSAVAAYVVFATSLIGVGKNSGLLLFSFVSSALFGWAIFSSWAGADSISSEKREGTLGFLFLTDLKSHDIVLGKLVAAALPSFYGLLAAMPLMSICLVMGGLTFGQYAKVGLAILNIFFLGQAVGMFSSALCRERGNAMGLPLLVLLLYPVVYGLEFRGSLWLSVLFQSNNPARPFYLALSGASATSAVPGYWVNLLITHLQAWIFFGLAVWVLPLRWRDKPKHGGFWKPVWERWRFGSLAKRSAFRIRLLAINPILWLVCRRRLSPALIWSGMGVVAILMAILSAGADTYGERAVFIIIPLQLMLRVGVPACAAMLEENRRNGLLETLLCCSPISVDDILDGMLLVVRRYYRWPIIGVVALQSLMLIVLGMTRHRHSLNIDSLVFIFVSMIVLIADVRAMVWLAMWTAMSNPKPRNAGATSFFCITMFPWILISLCYWTRWISSEHWVWILWPTFALLNDFIISRMAQSRLRKYFRLWAVPSYAEVLGFWGRQGRRFGLLKRRFSTGQSS